MELQNTMDQVRLTDFMTLVSFHTPRKYPKTRGFLFSVGIERGQRHETG